MNYLIISAYKFLTISIDELPLWVANFKQKTTELQLLGTILLSQEGINVFLAGDAKNIHALQHFLALETPFNDLSYRESWSQTPPFARMQVRIKAEIISMGKSNVQPAKKTAPYIQPEVLKQWFAEGKEMIVLDTRNNYEYDFGSFVTAKHLNIKNFRHFPDALRQLPESAKQKPIVTFCTGGIRCEKAAAYMQQQGFEEVYQLQGGILNYLTQCGADYFTGECFMFDNRISVNVALEATATSHCRSCQMPIENPDVVSVCPGCQGAVRV